MPKTDPKEVWALVKKIDAISEGNSLTVRLAAYATCAADLITDAPKDHRAQLVSLIVQMIEEAVEYVTEKRNA